jgi:hypothetical protein
MAAVLVEASDVLEIGTPKPADEYRNYVDSFRHDIVKNHYQLMRQNQSLEFAKMMLKKYSFDKPRQIMPIREAFKVLETYVDSSDPDVRYDAFFLSMYSIHIYSNNPLFKTACRIWFICCKQPKAFVRKGTQIGFSWLA